MNKNLLFTSIAFLAFCLATINAHSQILPLETFTTSADFSNNCSGPTNKFWVPGTSCTSNPSLTYSASGGCTGGQVQFSGSYNSYFGSFIRTPQVNCSGNTSVVLSFDVSNSYIASHIDGTSSSNTNDHMRIYMWDNHFSAGNYYYNATSITINGVDATFSDLNGTWFKFDSLRTCAHVEATFDFSTDGVTLADVDNLLFYLEPDCEYNDQYTYSVGIDNIGIGAAIPTSVNNLSNNVNWQVYPNPFHDYVLVQYNQLSTGAVAVISDVLGREVARTNIAVGTSEARINLPVGSSNGIYFVNLISADGKIKSKKMLRN